MLGDKALNRPLSAAPPTCDVLVVGAGPAGSACARALALAGRHVVLVDAQAFPRDKVCGDALVPDAHAALRRLGLHARVMARALPVTTARCVAPMGHFVDVQGEMAVLPRRELDAELCRAAIEAGAVMIAPARFEQPLRDATGRASGAVLSDGRNTYTLAARWLVLATGAAPAALLASGLCTRRIPSGLAVRAYVRHPALAQELPQLRFGWHRRLSGGYGWIFPGPGGVFNVGVGLLDNYADLPRSRWRKHPKRRSGANLREMFADFQAVDPVAQRLMREGELLSELKGAPFRCDLEGAHWSSAGILVAGEAAGTTYSFTGEGIGKAMETGLAAADSLLAHDHDGGNAATRLTAGAVSAASDAAVQQAYRHALQALLPRYASYRQAGSFNRHPWLANLVIWRARSSPRIQAKLSDVLNEQRIPGSWLTLRALRNIIKP